MTPALASPESVSSTEYEFPSLIAFASLTRYFIMVGKYCSVVMPASARASNVSLKNE